MEKSQTAARLYFCMLTLQLTGGNRTHCKAVALKEIVVKSDNARLKGLGLDIFEQMRAGIQWEV